MSISRVYLIIPTFQPIDIDTEKLRTNLVDFLDDRIENLRKMSQPISAYNTLDQSKGNGFTSLRGDWGIHKNALLVRMYLSSSILQAVKKESFNEDYTVMPNDITLYDISSAKLISVNGEPILLDSEKLEDEKLNSNSQLMFERHKKAISEDIFRFIAASTKLPREIVEIIMTQLNLFEFVMVYFSKTRLQAIHIENRLLSPIQRTSNEVKLLKKSGPEKQEWIDTVDILGGFVRAAIQEPNLQIAYQCLTQAIDFIIYTINESKHKNAVRFFRGSPTAFQMLNQLKYELQNGFISVLCSLPESFQLNYLRNLIDEAMKNKALLPSLDIILTYAFVTEMSPVKQDDDAGYGKLATLTWRSS